MLFNDYLKCNSTKCCVDNQLANSYYYNGKEFRFEFRLIKIADLSFHHFMFRNKIDIHRSIDRWFARNCINPKLYWNRNFASINWLKTQSRLSVHCLTQNQNINTILNWSSSEQIDSTIDFNIFWLRQIRHIVSHVYSLFLPDAYEYRIFFNGREM